LNIYVLPNVFNGEIAMKLIRRFLLAVAWLWVAAAGPATAVAGAAHDAPLRIHMISGSGEYKSEPSLKQWAAMLEEKYHVVCTLSLGRDGGADLPNLEELDRADLMVVFCRRMKLPEDQLARIKAWCDAGKPVIGIRTASHAFQTWLEFDNKVLGGTYSGHGGQEEVAVSIVEQNRDHPILRGVQAFTAVDKLYSNPQRAGGRHGQQGAVFPDDAVVLLTATGARKTERVAWCYVYNKQKNGRSFYVSPGYPHHFENENYLRLLKNAIEWTTQRTLQERSK
jgi:type 1 glutamine amidotransferase